MGLEERRGWLDKKVAWIVVGVRGRGAVAAESFAVESTDAVVTDLYEDVATVHYPLARARNSTRSEPTGNASLRD